MIKIDGSYGEGGGQILRTAVSLSCTTGKAVEIVNIRKARPKPGLQPQHLTAVKAAAAITNASVEGASLSSTEIRFMPGGAAGGEFTFDVSETKGSAGSVCLVLQTILLPLLLAKHASRVRLVGGTHVPLSPTFHYLKYVFLPYIDRNAELNLEQWGWYPAGGGIVTARLIPVRSFRPLIATAAGNLKKVGGISAVSNLPDQIAERQRQTAAGLLALKGIPAEIEILRAPSQGKGTLLFLLAEFENAAAGFDALGALGKRAETVSQEACAAFFEYLQAGAAVDSHLADQLIPYLALASGVSEFTTSRVTKHLLTNIEVVRQFIDAVIRVKGSLGEPGSIRVEPRRQKVQ